MHLRNIFFVTVAFIAIAQSDIFEECGNLTDRRFIASNRSCQHYIFCDGDNSYEGECGEGDYFNELFQTCDPQELVECSIGNNTITTLSSPPSLTLPTATTTTTLSITAGTATTLGTTFASGSTTGTLLPSTTNLSTTTPSSLITSAVTNSPNATAAPIIISNKCPPIDNQLQMIFLPHPKSCSEYFVCYHGEAIPMHCSAMLHFDVKHGRCDYPENVKCQIEFANPREQCQSHTVDLYPHSSNCNYFYSCNNGFLLLQQCPFFYGWDYEKRTCLRLNQAICFNNRIHV